LPLGFSPFSCPSIPSAETREPTASSLLGVVLALGLSFGLSGCVTTGLAVTATSPWQPWHSIPRPARSIWPSPTDRHGFLVGSNRLILETEDGGASWQERSLDLPEGDNYRLAQRLTSRARRAGSPDSPACLLRTGDGGQNWERLLLDTKLPGEPYLVTAPGGPSRPNWRPASAAIYRTDDRRSQLAGRCQ